ncbi:hypothetical protein [Sphingomonas arenae]|uniref:hypothetical protein n=1 Tax=Sphingomonas arenae TaxID=2812555 RepID=UPI001968A342|nr:hypothetical protein [Sphingomonas arenae]
MRVVVSEHAINEISERLSGVSDYMDEFSALVSTIEKDPYGGRLLATSHSGSTYAARGETLQVVYNVPPRTNPKPDVAVVLSVGLRATLDAISRSMTSEIHIFRCTSDNELFFASFDLNGGDAPKGQCQNGEWVHFKKLIVSPNDPPRIGLNTHDLLRTLRKGKPYVFRSGVQVSGTDPFD